MQPIRGHAGTVLSVALSVYVTIQTVVEVRGQSYKVEMRFVKRIEEVDKPQHDEAEEAQVCGDANDSLIALCAEAMSRFSEKYKYIQFEDGGPKMETYRTKKKVGGTIKKRAVVQACRCPLNWPIYLREKLQSGNVVIAYARKLSKEDKKCSKQSHDERAKGEQSDRSRPTKSGGCCRGSCSTGGKGSSGQPSATDGFLAGCFAEEIFTGVCHCFAGACHLTGEWLKIIPDCCCCCCLLCGDM